MKISFIIVNLNNHFGLKKTITNLLNLRNEFNERNLINYEFEFIVIDGDSGFEDKKILNYYLNDLTIVVSEKDQGIYDAMNKGINLSSGNYINFMNSGDVSIIKNMVTAIQRLDGNKFIFGKCEWNQKIISLFPEIISTFFCKMPNHQAIFFPRDWHIKNLYNLQYKIAADLDVKLKLFKEVSHLFINLPLVLSEAGGVSQKIKNFKEIKIRAREIYNISIKNNGLLSANINYLIYIIWHTILKEKLK